MLLARIFTLYPEFFPGPLGKGLYGKALSDKIWNLETVNIRDYATDRHKTVDDTIYGGGTGMLIKPDVIANSLDKNLNSKEKIIYLSPKGKLFNQKLAKELTKETTVNLICGHFEGIDQRVIETRKMEVSRSCSSCHIKWFNRWGYRRNRLQLPPRCRNIRCSNIRNWNPWRSGVSYRYMCSCPTMGRNFDWTVWWNVRLLTV